MRKEQLLTDLTDEQCEKVVGGVGIGATPETSAGVNGWFGGPNRSGIERGLNHAGFTPQGADNILMSGSDNMGTIVPGDKDG